MWIHWPFFSKNLNQRSLTPRWPLTPCLLRSHVWLYPRIIVSKSHDNTSMYVDTVINFAKYHIHTHTYYIHTHTTYRMSDHIVSYWTHQFRRDKKATSVFQNSKFWVGWKRANIFFFWPYHSYWATPFKIYTPPVEDFWKVYHRWCVNFQMYLPSVWFLDQIYHRGSKYFI